MSRTYKDAPWQVREIRWNNKRVPADWREKLSWHQIGWIEAEENWNELFGEHHWRYMSHAPAEFRRDLNRSYRAKTKQAVRSRQFEIDRPRHNAAWLWW